MLKERLSTQRKREIYAIFGFFFFFSDQFCGQQKICSHCVSEVVSNAVKQKQIILAGGLTLVLAMRWLDDEFVVFGHLSFDRRTLKAFHLPYSCFVSVSLFSFSLSVLQSFDHIGRMFNQLYIMYLALFDHQNICTSSNYIEDRDHFGRSCFAYVHTPFENQPHRTTLNAIHSRGHLLAFTCLVSECALLFPRYLHLSSAVSCAVFVLN